MNFRKHPLPPGWPCIICALFYLGLTAVPFPAGGAVPTLFGAVRGNETAANCGMYVTAFTLDYFRKRFGLPQIAAALGTGAGWENPPNLLRIKRLLLRFGLRVAAYKDATFADVSAELAKGRRRSVAIVFLKNRVASGEIGHYFVLLHGPPGRIFVGDIGNFVGTESLENLNDRLGRDFSGMFLLVRPGGAPAATRAFAASDSRIVLRVGDIASGPGVIRVPFILKNTASRPISIALAKGTCYCFRGARIIGHGGTIEPGQASTIVMKFRRSVIGIGNIEREVLFRFAGYNGHLLRVVIQAHITAAHTPTQLTWYPSQVSLGIVRNRNNLNGEEFTVLVPKGELLGRPISSTKNISVIELASPSGVPQTDDFGRTVQNYVIDLANLPDGLVDDKITIPTTDKHVPRIVIHVEGKIVLDTPKGKE